MPKPNRRLSGETGSTPNPQDTDFTATERASIDGGVADLAQRISRRSYVTGTGMGEAHSTGMPNEDRNANLILKVSHSAADRGFLDIKHLGGAPKASIVGGG